MPHLAKTLRASLQLKACSGGAGPLQVPLTGYRNHISRTLAAVDHLKPQAPEELPDTAK